ncbi:MAG: orotidine-5'-phosphate decarboxylase [Flavobacteriales bacterium]
MNLKEKFLLSIFELGIIKFGQFTLKSGVISPFYIDLRSIASRPDLLKHLSHLMMDATQEDQYKIICGVPYSALPMATAMSLSYDIPLIIKRKENKGYGTKKLIEGVYKKGNRVLLVEDVITSGKSLIETIEEVENEGLIVESMVVVIDRQQGGSNLLRSKGYKLHTLFTIEEALQILDKHGRVGQATIDSVLEFVQDNQDVTNYIAKRKSYEEKLKYIQHPKAHELVQIALKKKSNLICAADLSSGKEILKLAEEVGKQICALKLHVDVYEDFTQDFIVCLKELAKKYEFLIFEDRKFADIGNTQKLQFEKGLYKIADWADLITTHVIAGKESLEAFANSSVAVVPILEMSSKGALTSKGYLDAAKRIAMSNPQVIGGVAQSKLPEELLLFTPGIHFETVGDNFGQQYNTPEKVFKEYETDFIIVGRGIYQAENTTEATKKYQKLGWEAYKNAL